MQTPRVAPASDQSAAQLAKAALRRLGLEKLDPTPENYARAYQQEGGGGAAQAAAIALPPAVAALSPEQAAEQAAEQATALAKLIERIVRGVQQGGRQWTSARKKESLQRVLSSSRSDTGRLLQRLGQLMGSWEGDKPDETVETDAAPLDDATAAHSAHADTAAAAEPALERIRLAPQETSQKGPQERPQEAPPAAEAPSASPQWAQALACLAATVQEALPPPPAPSELADELAALMRAVPAHGPSAEQIEALDQLCQRAHRVLQHRHHLVDQLSGLCEQLTGSLTELAEDDSWARGQCDAMRQEMEFGLTARSVRSVIELLGSTRDRQQTLRTERAKARDALKTLINQMLGELGELGSHTSRFHENLGRYAGEIEQADTLESLAGAVRGMVEESRTVQSLVSQAQGRLQYEHTRATGLSDRVAELETELRRLAQEVSTDQLTKIANRRGLLQAFDAERARQQRDGSALAIGLLDIDNFKRLNDELGHGAGDEALKTLAAVVSTTLRPTDMVARYGGEEFVVLLPNTPLDEGAQILTRLQRSLSGGLFMHENKQIFVTFSAGITLYRPGERIEIALERADEALYEAKRTGKNRTCLG